jgi:hypothetical protein
MDRGPGARAPFSPRIAFGIPLLLPVIAIGLSSVHQLPNLASLLSLAGAILAGGIVSHEYRSPIAYLVLAASLFLASFGFPADWDSYRMFARIATVVALSGALIAAVPVQTRYALGSVMILFHFGGILVATTWPPQAPWLTDQLGTRVYQPYLKFMYLGNAYHFYSPDPGPARHVWFLVTYEKVNEIDPKTGKPLQVLAWVTFPTRPDQVRDPMALTYQRRLALSEHMSHSTPDIFSPVSFEKNEAYARRRQVAAGTWPGYPKIPLAPEDLEPSIFQYHVPTQQITSYLLPSYVRHVASDFDTTDMKPVKVKTYLLEHRIIRPNSFLVNKNGPYHPSTYRCYFLGDYSPDGNLMDPQDPMLYWLIPILPNPSAAEGQKTYIDYLEKHANVEVTWRRL